MVCTCSLNSKFSWPFTILGWLNQAHQLQLISLSLSYFIFFRSLASSRDLYLFSLPLIFLCDLLGKQSLLFGWFTFLFVITRSVGLAKTRWSIVILKPRSSLYISFSREDSRLYIYHLFVWPNSNFLHNSQWVISPLHFVLICCIRLCEWSFVSVTKLPTFAILFHLIYSYFDIVCPYRVVLCWYKKRFSFFL